METYKLGDPQAPLCLLHGLDTRRILEGVVGRGAWEWASDIDKNFIICQWNLISGTNTYSWLISLGHSSNGGAEGNYLTMKC